MEGITADTRLALAMTLHQCRNFFCQFQFEQVTRKPQQPFHFEFHYGKKILTHQTRPFSDENYENT